LSDSCKLSICIPTLNRGEFIGETLDAIVPQLTPEVELVIVDGGSTDDTESIVRAHAAHCDRIRYVRRDAADSIPSNEGFDRDCDWAVELARGRHCWLFTDDDLIVPGAIRTVLDDLADGDPDLLVIDAEVRDLALKQVLDGHRLSLSERRDYGPDDRDAFMADAGSSLSFVGTVIIRRASWLERDRASYYGTGFIHVCVIFQPPALSHIRILPLSLVQIRMGNAAWIGRAFEIWMFQWPALIWGFEGYSEDAKAKVRPREPWRQLRSLLVHRAYGSFGRPEYRKHLAHRLGRLARLRVQLMLMVPGRLAHIMTIGALAISPLRRGSFAYNLLVSSRNSNPLSRAIGRLAGQPLPSRPGNH
jgi:glycosyltransferase involved in cell wall biosynthesis